jgi:hypothetical protein
MFKSTYDTNDNGVVDNSEKLGGQGPSYYATKEEVDQHKAENAIQTNIGGTADAITITTGGNFAYTQGNPLKFKAVADSTTNVTINVDSKGAKALKKLDGTQVGASVIKNGKVYEIYFDVTGDCFFLLAKASGTAQPSDVLAPQTFSNDDGEQVGSMVEQGSKTFTPTTSQQTSGAGHYSGITVNAITPNAGDYLVGGASSSYSRYQSSYAQAPIGTVKTYVAGIIRISFNLSNSNSGDSGYVYAQIYKNGVACGVQRSTNSNTDTTFTEDFACQPGDIFSLWLHGDGASATSSARYFKVAVADSPVQFRYQGYVGN